MKKIKTSFGLGLAIISLALLAGCSLKIKEDASQEEASKIESMSGQINHPKFKGPGDFIKSYNRVSKIFMFKKLDGQKVLRPWVDEDGWLTPYFREQLCLVVTINNHCVG